MDNIEVTKHSYEVTIRSTTSAVPGNWTMTWEVASFAHAEHLTQDMLVKTKQSDHNEIIKIEKDYDAS